MSTTLERPAARPARVVRAPRGPERSCKGWVQEAALRMLMNNLDPEVAEAADLVVLTRRARQRGCGGAGTWNAAREVARAWEICAEEKGREVLHYPRGKPREVGQLRISCGALEAES